MNSGFLTLISTMLPILRICNRGLPKGRVSGIFQSQGIFNRYRVRGPLGSGSRGEKMRLYEIHHPAMDRSEGASSEVFGGRTVTVRPCGSAGAPAVYVCMYQESGEALLEACRSIGCPGFDLVTLSGLDWNADLSPWPLDRVTPGEEPFAGRADRTLSLLEDSAIPFAEDVLGRSSVRVTAGYSMAGLFSLHVPYVSDLFSSAASVSGSLWYPEFAEMAGARRFVRRPDAVYISVGDREHRVRNPLMASTEECARRLADLYSGMGIPTKFELNPGNHFRDAELRLAKGIAWVLGTVCREGSQ